MLERIVSYQGDANYDLDDYPNNAFSTVILSQTIQTMIFLILL